MPKVLADPDGIWLNNYDRRQGYDNYTLIKHYQDEMVVVCCQIDKGTVNVVRTWFPLHMRKSVINKTRRGLLVHKKAPR